MQDLVVIFLLTLFCVTGIIFGKYGYYPNAVTVLPISPSNENCYISLKGKEPSINQTQLWYLHLGHINLSRI